MRLNPRYLFFLLILLSSFSGITQVRKYSNEFLAIGLGARGLAMGRAQVASVSDATSGYWNPAGLTQMKRDINFSIMHAEYFAGIAKLDYGTFALPLKDGKRFIGFSFSRFAVDDIPYTLDLIDPADGQINYDNVRAFSVGDYAVLLTYAQKLPIEGLSLGGNIKVIYRKAGDFANAWGFGLDIGARYNIKGFMIGVNATDITSTFNAWSFNFSDKEKEIFTLTDNIIPENSLEITTPKFIFGAAYEFNIKDKFFILPEINFEMSTDGKRNVPIRTNAVSFDPRFGLELNYARIVYVRAGVNNIQQQQDDVTGEKIVTVQPNIGVGIQIKGVSIDYAYTDIGDASAALFSNIFSLNVGINKRKKN